MAYLYGGPLGARPLGFAEPASSCAIRLEIPRVPLLASHRTRGTPASEPDLIVRVNRAAPRMDLVVHFHGYSGRGEKMNLAADKEPHSGLDYCKPDDPATAGRQRPTVGLLPRGHFFGGKSGKGYDFPALVRPGALLQLIAVALPQLERQPATDRFILTGHSGGGAPIMRVLPLLEGRPDEVHVFDGLYTSVAPLVAWMNARIARDAAGLRQALGASRDPAAARQFMAARGGAMRVIFRRDGPRSTEPQSMTLAAALERALRRVPDVAPHLCRFYRVEDTRLGHSAIPRAFGFRLLADAGADVPGAQPVRRFCAAPPAGVRPAARPSAR
jgi:hypothetical protein